jgi:hypothetical protein
LQDIPAEGTIIVDNLDTYAEDIDNDLVFRVTSQQPYTLAIEGNEMKIRSIPQDYSGRETVTVTCNNVPTTFDLGINEPFLTEIFRKEDFPSDVLTRIFMNDKLLLAYNHPYLTILSVPGFGFVRTDEIGYSGKKYLADTGRFIFMGDTYDGNLYKMDRQSFTPITSVETGGNFNSVVTNGTYVYAILGNTVEVYNENLGLITTYTSPFDFAGNSAFAHEDELAIGRSDREHTMFDIYRGLNFEKIFTGSMTSPEETGNQWRDILFGCGDHLMLVSSGSIKVYDVNSHAVLQSETFGWAIMNTAIGNDYVYYELYNNYKGIRDIHTWQNWELDLHGVTNQDGVGFYNDLFLYGADGAYHASVVIYQMNGK